MLRVEDISKRFEKVIALDKVSFTAKIGEVLGIIGPNGSGKTTLIRIISALLKPDEGRVFFDDINVQTNHLEAKGFLSYVPELPMLLANLTVEEHIDFVARVNLVKGYKAQADELIKRFDLEDKRKSDVGTLSKGQGQKVNIISALIKKPRLLLFDEPLIGVDPKAALNLRKLIREHAASGAVVIISSHQLPVVEDVADRILFLQKGKVAASGTLDELKASLGAGRDAKLEDLYMAMAEDAE